MKLIRRQFNALGVASLAGCVGLSSSRALAADEQRRVLVGYAPGGAADNVARIVGDGLREGGYGAIVENRPGAAGRIALEALRGAAPDGRTLVLMPTGNLTLAPQIYPGARFDPVTDFAGVGSACRMSFAIAVGADSPAKTLPEFLDLARNDSAMAAFGTPGAGTAMHFIGEILARQSRVALTQVPYRGGSAAVTDAIGGTIPSVITTLPNLLPMHRTGRLRILAISSETPVPALPGIPTFTELGFKDLAVMETFVYIAPAGTPTATLADLNKAITAAVRGPKVRSLLEEAEYEIHTSSPAELDQKLRDEYVGWKNVIDLIGFKLES